MGAIAGAGLAIRDVVAEDLLLACVAAPIGAARGFGSGCFLAYLLLYAWRLWIYGSIRARPLLRLSGSRAMGIMNQGIAHLSIINRTTAQGSVQIVLNVTIRLMWVLALIILITGIIFSFVLMAHFNLGSR